jgi:hypothetical protein
MKSFFFHLDAAPMDRSRVVSEAAEEEEDRVSKLGSESERFVEKAFCC